MNEKAEIWQGMKDHDRVAVMDRACKDEAEQNADEASCSTGPSFNQIFIRTDIDNSDAMH